MNNIDIFTDDDLSLLRQVPHVLRARGFRLYLNSGKRLIDLWLNGGAAVLGHTTAKMLREIKNSAGRGLYAPYPHFTENRFIKALSKLLPGRHFRLYAAPPKELKEFFIKGKAKLWRPYLTAETPFKTDDTPFIIPVLSGIHTWRNGLPLGLCITAAASEELFVKLPKSDSFSPVLLAAAARGIYDILASPQRAKLYFPRVMKELNSSIWQRRGIYLTLKKENNKKEWEALFQKFLETDFLLPPIQTHPLILPAEMSDGEEKKLVSALNK